MIPNNKHIKKNEFFCFPYNLITKKVKPKIIKK